MKNTAYVTLGCPASGKSTYYKSLCKSVKNKIKYISSDVTRDDLFAKGLLRADKYAKQAHSVVFAYCHQLIKEAIEQKQDVYFDATNINRKKRTHLYNQIKQWNTEVNVVILVFLADLETLIERDSKREHTVGAEYIKKCYKSFQPPRLQVDCDEFTVVSSEGYPRFTKEFAKDTGHDCPYHKETVKEHIAMCLECVNKILLKDKTFKKQLMNIAHFHDLGKFICKEMNENGIASFKGHENVSSMYWLAFFTEGHSESTYKERLEVLEAIYQHMNAHNGLSDKIIKRNKLTQRELELIEMFRKIDEQCRIR